MCPSWVEIYYFLILTQDKKRVQVCWVTSFGWKISTFVTSRISKRRFVSLVKEIFYRITIAPNFWHESWILETFCVFTWMNDTWRLRFVLYLVKVMFYLMQLIFRMIHVVHWLSRFTLFKTIIWTCFIYITRWVTHVL